MAQPSTKRPSLDSQSGFTLLEVIAAFVVLMLAVSGLVFMGTVSTRGNTSSQNQAEAVSLATYKLEQLKAMDFNSASLVTSSDPQNGIFSRSWTVGGAYTLAGLQAKDLAVSVSWTGGGTVTLSTTIIDPALLSAGALQHFPTVTVTSWSSL